MPDLVLVLVLAPLLLILALMVVNAFDRYIEEGVPPFIVNPKHAAEVLRAADVLDL